MARANDVSLTKYVKAQGCPDLQSPIGNLRTYAPVRFDLAVLTIDPEVPGFDPSPLRDYYASLGLNWYYERQPIMEQAKSHMDGDSFCAYCARMKRGIMYRVCRREGYPVLALGQQLDDLAESLMMSIFHGGQLRTMKAHYRNDAGDVRIIRPLAYCRERQPAAFAQNAGLPVIRTTARPVSAHRPGANTSRPCSPARNPPIRICSRTYCTPSNRC